MRRRLAKLLRIRLRSPESDLRCSQRLCRSRRLSRLCRLTGWRGFRSSGGLSARRRPALSAPLTSCPFPATFPASAALRLLELRLESANLSLSVAGAPGAQQRLDLRQGRGGAHPSSGRRRLAARRPSRHRIRRHHARLIQDSPPVTRLYGLLQLLFGLEARGSVGLRPLRRRVELGLPLGFAFLQPRLHCELLHPQRRPQLRFRLRNGLAGSILLQRLRDGESLGLGFLGRRVRLGHRFERRRQTAGEVFIGLERRRQPRRTLLVDGQPLLHLAQQPVQRGGETFRPLALLSQLDLRGMVLRVCFGASHARRHRRECVLIVRTEPCSLI